MTKTKKRELAIISLYEDMLQQFEGFLLDEEVNGADLVDFLSSRIAEIQNEKK